MVSLSRRVASGAQQVAGRGDWTRRHARALELEWWRGHQGYQSPEAVLTFFTERQTEEAHEDLREEAQELLQAVLHKNDEEDGRKVRLMGTHT